MIEVITGLAGLALGFLFGYRRGLASHEDADDEIMGSMYEAAVARANRLERRLDAALNQNNEHRKAEHEQVQPNPQQPTHADRRDRQRKPYIST